MVRMMSRRSHELFMECDQMPRHSRTLHGVWGSNRPLPSNSWASYFWLILSLSWRRATIFSLSGSPGPSSNHSQVPSPLFDRDFHFNRNATSTVRRIWDTCINLLTCSQCGLFSFDRLQTLLGLDLNLILIRLTPLLLLLLCLNCQQCRISANKHQYASGLGVCTSSDPWIQKSRK